MSDSQIERLGLNKRKMSGKVGKHVAKNDAHIRSVLERLDRDGDAEAADTIAWLIWWNELSSVRMYEAWAKLAEAEGLAPIENDQSVPSL